MKSSQSLVRGTAIVELWCARNVQRYSVAILLYGQVFFGAHCRYMYLHVCTFHSATGPWSSSPAGTQTHSQPPTLTATGGATVLLITINPHVYVPPPQTTNGSSIITTQLLGPVHGKVGVKKKKEIRTLCVNTYTSEILTRDTCALFSLLPYEN